MEPGLFAVAFLCGGLFGGAIGNFVGYSSCSRFHKKLEREAADRERDRADRELASKASGLERRAERIESSVKELQSTLGSVSAWNDEMTKWVNAICKDIRDLRAKVAAITTQPAPTTPPEPEAGEPAQPEPNGA